MRYILLCAALLVSGCASYGSGCQGAVTLTVENNNFADVTIRDGTTNRRLMFVGGLSTTTKKVCGLMDRPDVLSVHPIGSSRVVTLRGPGGYFRSSALLRLGPTFNLSFLWS